MKELDPRQIAAVLAGQPFSPWPELRLLLLFQTEAGDEVVVELIPGRESLPEAA